MQKYLIAAQGAEVEEELRLVKDDIRDTRAYLKVEIEPEIEFLKGMFETAENYRKNLDRDFSFPGTNGRFNSIQKQKLRHGTVERRDR